MRRTEYKYKYLFATRMLWSVVSLKFLVFFSFDPNCHHSYFITKSSAREL